MKYNEHIYFAQAFALIFTGCEALFSFRANAKLNDITGVVNHPFP